MKKTIVGTLVAVFILNGTPAFAQFKSMPISSIGTKIKFAIERTWLRTQHPTIPHIKITNFPGQPLVKLGAPLAEYNATAVRPAPVLSARVLSGKENYKEIFLAVPTLDFIYAPSVLNAGENVAYRGMKLYDLQSVQNILENGIEYTKVSEKYEHKIYFSNSLHRAAWHAVQYDSADSEIPVLIKFAMPSKNYVHTERTMWGEDYYCWLCNIPAHFIKDVMVFLEVNGEVGWYKAILENKQLVFIPMASEILQGKLNL